MPCDYVDTPHHASVKDLANAARLEEKGKKTPLPKQQEPL
jgi:hypothetical protein